MLKQRLLTLAPHGLALFTAAVFLDSLRFKFTDHPNTQEIFGRLDGWAGTIGFPGLFSHSGLFSQYVIGSAELLASALLIAGIAPALRILQPLGAALGVAIMTGAISFHLFTPLGVEVNNDGGALFATACATWFANALMLFIRRKEAIAGLRALRARFTPAGGGAA